MKTVELFLITLLIFTQSFGDDTINTGQKNGKKHKEHKHREPNNLEPKIDALTKQVEELKQIVKDQHREMLKKFEDMQVVTIEE